MLTPTQIQRMCTNYYVADYEVRRCHSHRISMMLIESTDADFARDPACSRLTGFAQRPQRPPPARARDGGGRALRTPPPARGLWAGDLRACIPQRSASAEARGSGSIAVLVGVMSIRVSFCISLCYGIRCNGNLRLFPDHHSHSPEGCVLCGVE